MFSHDEFTKRSLSNFLRLDCLSYIDSQDIKEKFSSFVIKDTEENRKKIFSNVPVNLITDNKKENFLKITKVDLLHYQKIQMANPIRTWGNKDEYNTRLITSLFFQATPGWYEYCKNLYDHGQDHYMHDQRAGCSRAKQFLNWMCDDGYPGRLKEQNEYESLIPLCFPNPELLKSYFTYIGNGRYALTVLDDWKDSVLYKLLNKFTAKKKGELIGEENSNKMIGLLKESKINEDQKVIHASFCIWQEVIAEILKEQNLEKQLSEEQQKVHVVSLIIEFVKNRAIENKEEIQNIKQLQEKVMDFIYDVNNEVRDENPIIYQVQMAIKALYKVRKNISANKEFFNKFTDDKGVLQSEQYFRSLTAHIDSEITFLDTFKKKLTEEDLKTFLNKTCKKVHSDISELLITYDFLLTDNLEYRDIVINITPKETKELHEYISKKVNYYNELTTSYKGVKTEEDLEKLKKYLKELDSEVDVEHLVTAIKGKKNIEGFKNEWLLYQVKSHSLCEFFNIKNTSETQAKIGELSKIVEANNLNKNLDRSNFICGLRQLASSCTDNQDIKLANNSTENVVKEYIKESRWLEFKQLLYDVSYYIPLSSIWLSHINPCKSRTKTKYKGKTLKEKLYAKNRVVQCSEFSRNIRKALSLSTDNKEFVESKHEAIWLIKTFRKKHGISGAKEKVLIYLGKNKILWYTLLTIFILLTSAAAIAGRVLSYLSVIPPVAVDKMINGLRGIFDGFVVMLGLDTIIDSIFILAVDLAGLVVRTIDYILLFSLISKVMRFLSVSMSKVVKGINSAFKALCEIIRIYSLKGSLILLFNKILNNKQPTKEKKCKIEEKIQKKKDIMIGQKGSIDNISSSIQNLWVESLIVDSKSNVIKRIRYIFDNIRSQIKGDLSGQDIKFPILLSNFSDIHDLFESPTDWNFVKFRYGFYYLLNRYPEKFLGSERSLKRERVSAVEYHQVEGQKEDLTVEDYRMKIYDVMAAISLQTRLSPEKQEKIALSNNNAKNLIKKCVDEQAKEFISQKILNKKIAAIKWAINTLESSDIEFAIKKAEPIFQTTKAHLSAHIALCDYSKKLKELRKCPSKEGVSSDELSAYEMIFAQHIANAHYILSFINKFTAKNHECSSLHQFREAFSDNCVLLIPPSREAKNAALILGIDRGGVSIISRIKEYTMDFVEEFQDPRVLAVAFAAYYIAVQIPGLLEVAHTIADVPEIMLDNLGLEVVYEHFLKTDVGRMLIKMVYQRGELLKDVWVLFNEFKDGVIGESEIKKHWSEVKQAVKKVKLHNNHNHYDCNNAKKRLASFINGFVHFLLSIFCINLIRSLLHKVKTEYRTFSYYYYQEKQVMDIGNDTLIEKGRTVKSTIDSKMYNLPKILEYLNDQTSIERVFCKIQSSQVCG